MEGGNRVGGPWQENRGNMNYLLLIDDNPEQLVTQVREAFPAGDVRLEVARTGDDGLALVRATAPDVVLLNLRLPDQSGLAVYRQIRSFDERVPVIFVTGSVDASAAIEAIKQGAFDCLLKPPDQDQLGQVVAEALEFSRVMRDAGSVAEAASAPDTDEPMVGSSEAMRHVYKAIGLVAAHDFPVLITGESGTGKELVAKCIHQYSDRAGRTLIALNAAAIPETLLETELFGHEKGAFTGAIARRLGKFEECHGGTLFLDEIGDMSLASQAKMLRVLQEQSFERVGSNQTVRTNVRIVAATNRDLASWAAEGKFRQDLYYRLSVFPIRVPPLRERIEDLPALVHHYLRRFGRELGRSVHEIAPDALERLSNHTWPGNIRELQSVLKQALLQSTGSILLRRFLPQSLNKEAKPSAASSIGGELNLEEFIRTRLRPDAADLYAETHQQVDRQLLTHVLSYSRGNVRQGARILGIARQTLRGKLHELGLRVNRSVQAERDDWSIRPMNRNRRDAFSPQRVDSGV
jgi:two-component system nitrogen regulation response regulator GlnG